MSENADQIAAAFDEVIEEVRRATRMHAPYHSPHEGWAVIKEELDELWEHVRLKSSLRDRAKMREEARQIAATAVRFMVNLC